MTTLPQNELAERAVIGCILLGGQATALEAFSKLSDECFYTPRWQEAWSVIKAMSEVGTPIDGFTFLNEWVKQKRSLANDGIGETISAMDSIPISYREVRNEIESEAPTQWNLPYWVDELLELSDKRAAILAADAIAKDLASDSVTSGEAFSRLEDSLYNRNLERTDLIDSKTFVLTGMSDVERRFNERQTGNSTSLKTGLTDLDRITGGFELSEFVVIGARPNVGKTALAVTMAERFSLPVLFISCEMSPQATYRRYVAVHSRTSARSLKTGNLSESDFKQMHATHSHIQARQFTFVDGTAGIKISEIKSKVHAAFRRYGCKIVIVDYLQKVRPDETHEKRTYEVGSVSEALQAIARKQNVLVIALAQVSRDVAKRGGAPTIADLSDSSQIEKDADLILLMHRKRDGEGRMENTTGIYVAKARDGETDFCEVVFVPEYTRFETITRAGIPA